MTVYTDSYYARQADRIARGPQLYGGNAAVASLRCFVGYQKDARWNFGEINGRQRWMTHTQMAIYGMLTRQAVTGGRTTMRAMAEEAHCCPSTVSRAILRFQAWGVFAVDVIRGRNGGVSVRQRSRGDALQGYAEAAWQRLKAAALKAANRARLNVASIILGGERDLQVPTSYMDATFIEERRIERDGARILAGEITPEEATRGLRRATEADQQWQRHEAWARAVIEERHRLDREEPDWDLILEDARKRWLS